MPIYEYACHDCKKIYQFFSKTMKVEEAPACPKCGKSGLERVLSSFAAISPKKSRDQAGADKDAEPSRENQGEGAGMGPMGPEGPGGDMDDPFAHMTPAQQAAAEREMMKLMDQAEGLDENDPRQLGHFMERMTEITGMKDKAMQEAIRRLKDGEDPEKIEEDMGDELGPGEGGEGPGGYGGYGHDPGLYDM